MRILDSRHVQPPPLHQVHLELTDAELLRIKTELARYALPHTSAAILTAITRSVS